MKSDQAGTYGETDERVLLLVLESGDAASLPRVLEKAGYPSMRCGTAGGLCQEIDRGCGAVLIDEDLLSAPLIKCMMSVLDRQPVWSELPIMVLLRHGSETQVGRDALLLPGEVTLVELPVRVNTLVSVVRNALRSRRRQYLVRDQLRALDESYRTLFDAIDEGFCVLEVIFDENGKPVDYRFLSTNRSFDKHTGLENAQGKTMRELAPEHEEHWFRIYGQVALTGEAVRFEDFAKELHRWFEVHSFRIGEPEARQVAVVFSDITVRKQAESDLRQAKDDLEVRVQQRTEELTQALERLRAETEERIRAGEELNRKDQLLMQQGRMAAIGEMIGFIAHQWRQPLNTMGLIVQELPLLYQMGSLDLEYLQSRTAAAMGLINQMSQTIDDFRNFFKSDKRKVTFSVEEVLRNTIKLVQSSFHESHVEIEVSAEADVMAEGYPNEYSQVLMNVLMNARDALVERQTQQPRIAIRIFRENGKAVTTIADNAGGIAEDAMDRIFDANFTTKGDKGTGIGLYMSKIIIERNMGGALKVRNAEAGAEFRIET